MKRTAGTRTYVIAASILLLSAIAAWGGLQVARQRAAAPASMASMLPQGALLTIESPDFSALLAQWNASPEQKAWLASDNFSVFSNSRLFGRLNDARAEFEATARPTAAGKAGVDGDFLKQVAGHQSIFAWYDVGNLEFLYITRMSSAQAGNIALLKQRGAYTARQVAGTTFYMRKSSAGAAPQPEEQAASAQGKARTVAFAQVSDPGGDLLLLATREDLIANALQLLRPAANAARGDSVATEPWYTEASAAIPPNDHPPALHMVLNLERLVPLAYFRSYWVQQNVEQMRQYRAAVSDLYPAAGKQFQESRALLLKSAESAANEAYLGSLEALAPPTGVYRVAASQDAQIAVTALEEKLLGRIATDRMPTTDAPDPSLDPTQSGSAGDLETRIDAAGPVTLAVPNDALANVVKAAGLDAVMTYSTALVPPTSEGLWVPIHSAVILQAASPWSADSMQSALEKSLRGSLTTATLGIDFKVDRSNAGPAIYALTGPKPLFFAALSVASPRTSPKPVNLCVLSDDRALLLSLLARAGALPQTQSPALPAPSTLAAGFDHSSQRAPFARLTTLIDGTNQPLAPGQKPPAPTFFSGSMRSLSSSFADLASEHFTERRDGAIVRQTVVYQWTTP